MGTLAQRFEQGEQTSLKGHFHNLILLARMDGTIAGTERDLLNKIANRLSLTDDQVKEIIGDPEEYPAIPPYSREERVERFIQLVQMANADGVLSDSEAQLIRKLGTELGLSDAWIGEKFPVILDKLKSGNSHEDILAAIL